MGNTKQWLEDNRTYGSIRMGLDNILESLAYCMVLDPVINASKRTQTSKTKKSVE